MSTRPEMSLVQRLVELHAALAEASLPHAFGGALALAWCTQHPRGTIDIDVNIFVSHDSADEALSAMPDGVKVTDADRRTIAADGQTRLWWGRTPIDVFFNTVAFHEETSKRIRVKDFAGHRIPFLACRDLAVFKAFFDRTQDWADLERMAEAGTLEADAVIDVLTAHLGADDPRIKRLQQLA